MRFTPTDAFDVDLDLDLDFDFVVILIGNGRVSEAAGKTTNASSTVEERRFQRRVKANITPGFSPRGRISRAVALVPHPLPVRAAKHRDREGHESRAIGSLAERGFSR
jgi:hypothetical protein